MNSNIQTGENAEPALCLNKGILIPAYKTKGHHRMYSEDQLNEIFQRQKPKERINIGYARVSAKHQKEDLERQIALLELYLAKQF